MAAVALLIAAALLLADDSSAWTEPAMAASWSQLGHGVSEKDLDLLPSWRPRAATGPSRNGELLEPDVASNRNASVAKEARPIMRHERNREVAAAAAISAGDATDMEALVASRIRGELERTKELVASISDDVEALCTRLERGLVTLREASGASHDAALQMVLRAIGLRPAESELARRALYGDDDADSALAMPRSLDAAQHVGLQSVPSQFACLLNKAKNWDVATALEIGTGSGWASAVIAAYLSTNKDVRRRPRAFRLHTLDLTDRRLDCVTRLQAALSVSFYVADAARVGGMEELPRHFDFCLIDHKATVTSLRTVLHDLKGRCRYFVIHGIASDLAPADFRKYWHDLKARQPNRTEECVQQGRTSNRSAMGFGIFQP